MNVRKRSLLLGAGILVAGLGAWGLFVLRPTTGRHDAGQEDPDTAVTPADPTLDTLRQGVQSNRSRFASLRVSWESETKYLPAWFALNEQRATDLEQQSAKTGLAEDEKQNLLAQATQLRDSNRYNQAPYRQLFDFWTDGRGFQIRLPRPGVEVRRREPFPSNPLTPVILAQVYPTTCIFSWAPAQTGACRAWLGIDPRDGSSHASVSDQGVERSVVNFQFPPLGRRAASWGTDAMGHPMDGCLGSTDGEFQVLGTRDVRGRKTILLERVSGGTAVQGLTTHPGQLLAVEITRYWLDPAQGFLPLRVESGGGWKWDGKVLGRWEDWARYRIYDLVEVATVGSGFYPQKSITTAYFGDPALAQNPADIDKLIAGAAVPYKTVPYQQTTWTATRIENDREMPAAMFSPRFPEDTDVLDTANSAAPIAVGSLRIGDPAPAWVVAEWTDGKSHSLAEFRNRLILIDFWGVWCSPCIHAIPAMEIVQKKYPNQLACVGIHTAGAQVEKVRETLTRLKLTFPCAIDCGSARQGTTCRAYGVSSFPHMVLINREGKIAWTSADKENEAVQEAAAKRLGIRWPPGEMSEYDMHRLHAESLSVVIDRLLSSNK